MSTELARTEQHARAIVQAAVGLQVRGDTDTMLAVLMDALDNQVLAHLVIRSLTHVLVDAMPRETIDAARFPDLCAAGTEILQAQADGDVMTSRVACAELVHRGDVEELLEVLVMLVTGIAAVVATGRLAWPSVIVQVDPRLS